jgi:XRE family transcriptional regulator, regulator of sulfur utilization
MKVGKTIKTLRQHKGIRQKALAADCGITASYLSQIEADLKEPNLSTLKVICEKLSTPLPLFLLMSLEEADIQEEKKLAFSIIKPSFEALIKEIYT